MFANVPRERCQVQIPRDFETAPPSWDTLAKDASRSLGYCGSRSRWLDIRSPEKNRRIVSRSESKTLSVMPSLETALR